MPVPLPPIAEQKAIALTLSDTDALIAACDRAITKKRNIKQGAMQQLLTGNKRLPGFSGDWEVKKLGRLFKFKNGVNAEKKHYGKGIKFINILEVIQRNSIFYNDIPGLINLDTEAIKSNCVLKGDVLFNRTSETQEEIGLAAVYLDDKEVVFGGFVIRARPINDLIDSYFCKYAFSSLTVRNQIIKKGQGAIRANIGQSDLKEIFILLPSLPEQKAIAQILSDMDAEIAALEKKRDKYKAVKQGMMQELLTGKTRLIEKEC
jgi:type I restriction enzyme, S subunit